MDRRPGLIDRLGLLIHTLAIGIILAAATYIYTTKDTLPDTLIGGGLLLVGLYLLYHLAKVATIHDYWPR